MNKSDIVYNKFYKTASISGVISFTKGLGTLAKNFKWGQKLLNFSDELARVSAGGVNKAEGINFLKRYSSLNIERAADGRIVGRLRPGNAGFFQNRIGDAVDYISRLGAGINGNMSFTQGVRQFVKNFWNTEKALYRDATYKIVDPKNPTPFGRFLGIENRIVDGKLVSNVPFAKPRPIVGYTEDGASVIVKKRMFPRALSYSLTPTGLTTTGLLLGADAPTAVGDALLWTPPLRTIGEAKLVKDLLL